MKYLKIVSALIAVGLMSACTSEGVGNTEFEPISAAANTATESPNNESDVEVTDSEGTSNESASENTDGGNGESTDVGTTTDESTSTEEAQTTTTVPTTPTSDDIPEVRFKGSDISDAFAGDTVELNGSASYIDNGEIVSYEWSQPDDGQTLVELVNTNSAKASFIATPEINGELLTFKLKVLGSNGSTRTGRFMYAWTVTPADSDTSSDTTSGTTSVTTTDTTTDTSTEGTTGGSTSPTLTGVTEPGSAGSDSTDSAAPIEDGHYVFGQAGEYIALSASSAFINDQEFNRIVHVNPALGTEIESYSLPDQPKLIAYLPTTNTLYSSLRFSDKLVKLDLNTNVLTEIVIPGRARGLTAHEDRIYYTVDNAESFSNYDLYSMDAVYDLPEDHGTLSGDQFVIDASGGVLISADSYDNDVERYELNGPDDVVSQQNNSDISSGASDISLTPNGAQLAVATGAGNGSDYTIHDIMADDLTVSNGAWDVGPYPTSAEFSPSGDQLAATDGTTLKVFDAYSHVKLKSHNITDAICNLDYEGLDNVTYSVDGKHVLIKQTCGINNEKSVLFFFAVP